MCTFQQNLLLSFETSRDVCHISSSHCRHREIFVGNHRIHCNLLTSFHGGLDLIASLCDYNVTCKKSGCERRYILRSHSPGDANVTLSIFRPISKPAKPNMAVVIASPKQQPQHPMSFFLALRR